MDVVSYMRPNTPHLVLGIENSMMLGRHFYCASTIADSCYGLVHTSTLGGFVTNQHHHRYIITFFRRILSMWIDHYMNGSEICMFTLRLHVQYTHNFIAGTVFKMAHVPDIMTHQGLCDFMLLGNIIEFTPVLIHRKDTKNEDSQIEKEEDVARWKYRHFIKWFRSKYVILVGDLPCDTWQVFGRSLSHFAATIFKYKDCWLEHHKDMIPPQDVSSHLGDDWRQFVPLFLESLGTKPHVLCWTGPEIRVRPREEFCRSLLDEGSGKRPADNQGMLNFQSKSPDTHTTIQVKGPRDHRRKLVLKCRQPSYSILHVFISIFLFTDYLCLLVDSSSSTQSHVASLLDPNSTSQSTHPASSPHNFNSSTLSYLIFGEELALSS
jgi:hypothetical protein